MSWRPLSVRALTLLQTTLSAGSVVGSDSSTFAAASSWLPPGVRASTLLQSTLTAGSVVGSDSSTFAAVAFDSLTVSETQA